MQRGATLEEVLIVPENEDEWACVQGLRCSCPCSVWRLRRCRAQGQAHCAPTGGRAALLHGMPKVTRVPCVLAVRKTDNEIGLQRVDVDSPRVARSRRQANHLLSLCVWGGRRERTAVVTRECGKETNMTCYNKSNRPSLLCMRRLPRDPRKRGTKRCSLLRRKLNQHGVRRARR